VSVAKEGGREEKGELTFSVVVLFAGIRQVVEGFFAHDDPIDGKVASAVSSSPCIRPG